MPDPSPADILVVAAKSQRALAARLATMLEEHGSRTRTWPDEDADDEADPAASLGRAAKRAGAIVVFVDKALAGGKAGDARELAQALAPEADKLTVVRVDGKAGSAFSVKSADTMPARGSLADMDEYGRGEVLVRLVHELRAEVDTSYKPEAARHFEEYKLLFDSTERLVERRREATQMFLGVNAAISAAIAFLVKDLSLAGTRLAVVTIPLFITGMIACRLWQRTIRQYEALVDWRYQQLRRMERRRFIGSYRLFGREWDAIYAPRPRRRFGFSGLEAMVPRVFLVLHALGIAIAVAIGAGVVERLRP
jgi:hypothetical protein